MVELLRTSGEIYTTHGFNSLVERLYRIRGSLRGDMPVYNMVYLHDGRKGIITIRDAIQNRIYRNADSRTLAVTDLVDSFVAMKE